jgi:2-dehydro-3-deoxyphosphogalactonate aldolase
MMLTNYFDVVPLIGILRGVTPQDAVRITSTLYEVGFRCLEIPLNSPSPLESIEAVVKALPSDCLIGAGTVMTPEQVAQIADAGGRLIVMPHADAEVISAAKRANLICTPGVATPTEAFQALANGADALKLFPSEQVPPAVLKAWLTVLPSGTICIPVGGITPQRMGDYWQAGARGFGLGSSLYRPGASAEEVAARGTEFVTAVAALQR